MIDGVVGNEISVYFDDLNEPEIKITYLEHGKDIYCGFLKTFLRKDVENQKVLEFLDWFWIEKKVQSIEKVNDIYQIIQSLLIPDVNVHYHARNFSHRRLVLNPIYQAKLPHPNYEEYKK